MIKGIYDYRHMIVSLVHRDLRARYQGSLLGFLWTFVNPLFQLIIYTIVFSTFMKMGIPKFYMFLFVALIPWLFFSACLIQGASCIVDNKELVKKMYFPRIVLPLSCVISQFVNMLFSFVVIFAVLAVTRFGFNFYALLFLPLVLLTEFVLALGIALLASSCTVYFRDLQHILNLLAMGWMYLTPIVYPISIVPEKYMPLLRLNPMLPIISAYRNILYDKQPPEMVTLLQALATGILLLCAGMFVFGRLQRNFVEEL